MKILNILCAALLLPLFAGAWESSGHETCGAIAYYYMKKHNPALISRIVNILKQHPWYNDEKRWGAKLAEMPDDEKDITLFMLASTFPDDARTVPELGGGEHTKWHYVDYPFVPAGSNATGKPPETPNAEEKLDELLKAMPRETDPAQKAIDLCWIFHIIEDIHQPLHTACMYDDNHPDGDRGGNLTCIMLPGREHPTKLHSYWDDIIKGNIKKIPETALILFEDPALSENNLFELKMDKNIHDWIMKESFPLACQQAYENGKINGTKENPTVVDEDYIENVKSIADRRVMLAGIRIAREMNELLP